MEELKASIPERIRTLIRTTPTSEITTSCSTLVKHFSTSHTFSKLLEQLVSTNLTTCAKDAEGCAVFKRDGNVAFGNRNFDEALSCYSKALRCAPVASNGEIDMSRAILFVNRAASSHKLGLLETASRDCERAIDICGTYPKAWFRRSCVKYDLKDFHGAVGDMETALACETSESGHLQIKKRLAQMEATLRSACSSEKEQKSSSSANSDKKCTVPGNVMDFQFTGGLGRLQMQWTEEKGRSLLTNEDLKCGSLVFEEDPYTAVVLKSSRDSHCHFCFEPLPADPVPCSGCAIPFYCSERCKASAIGSSSAVDLRSLLAYCKQSEKHLGGDVKPPDQVDLLQEENCKQEVPEDLTCSRERWGEHKPECGGASWSAILPVDAVLGARMLFCGLREDSGVLLENNKQARGSGVLVKVDGLCNHYDSLSPNDKVELHVLGVVIAHCIVQPHHKVLEAHSETVSVAAKLVGFIAQARVNAMAIYGMSSPDFIDNTGKSSHGELRHSLENSLSPSTSLCGVEQVKVAQGIFLVGSLLNHSCIPNVHASFISGRLFIRAVANIATGSSLELCYGPQVGGQNQLERKKELLARYFFTCSCPACSTLTLPDLVLRAYRCAKSSCKGVVLGSQLHGSEHNLTGDPGFQACLSALAEVTDVAERFGVQDELGIVNLTQHSTPAIDVSLISEGFVKSRLLREESLGQCLACGMVVDIEKAQVVVSRAMNHLDKAEPNLMKAEVYGNDAKRSLKALNRLRVTLHPYNEQLAKAEDIVSRIMCALSMPLEALKHCKRSIEILEHLYPKEHIVLGNEYLKLASVALMASDRDCARKSLALVDKIFGVHYGSDYPSRLSYVVRLKLMVQ